MSRHFLAASLILLLAGLGALHHAHTQGCTLSLCGAGKGAGSAIVTIDVCGTQQRSGAAAASPFDFTGLTITGGLSNSALVATVIFDTLTLSGISATWDQGGTNQAMTLIGTASTPGSAGVTQLYGLVAPTSGNKTLRIAYTGVAQMFVDACSYSGVNQAGGTTSFPNFNSATAINDAAPTVTIMSAVGHAVLAGITCNAHSLTSVNNTSIYTDNGGAVICAGANRAAGAASVVMSGVINIIDNWAVVGTDIAP